MTDPAPPPMISTEPPPVPGADPTAAIGDHPMQRASDSWRVRIKHWAGLISAIGGGGWAAYEAANAMGVKGLLVAVPVIIGIATSVNVAVGKSS